MQKSIKQQIKAQLKDCIVAEYLADSARIAEAAFAFMTDRCRDLQINNMAVSLFMIEFILRALREREGNVRSKRDAEMVMALMEIVNKMCIKNDDHIVKQIKIDI